MEGRRAAGKGPVCVRVRVWWWASCMVWSARPPAQHTREARSSHMHHLHARHVCMIDVWVCMHACMDIDNQGKRDLH